MTRSTPLLLRTAAVLIIAFAIAASPALSAAPRHGGVLNAMLREDLAPQIVATALAALGQQSERARG